MQKLKKNNSKETNLKIKIEMLNYALKMNDYIYSDINKDFDITSKKSNDDIEKEYIMSLRDEDELSVVNERNNLDELDEINEDDFNEENAQFDEFDEQEPEPNDEFDEDINFKGFNENDMYVLHE